jgi:hypothetical protein
VFLQLHLLTGATICSAEIIDKCRLRDELPKQAGQLADCEEYYITRLMPVNLLNICISIHECT